MKKGVPASRTGVPYNENRVFPVLKTSQGKPCSGPVQDCSVCKSFIVIILVMRSLEEHMFAANNMFEVESFHNPCVFLMNSKHL